MLRCRTGDDVNAHAGRVSSEMASTPRSIIESEPSVSRDIRRCRDRPMLEIFALSVAPSGWPLLTSERVSVPRLSWSRQMAKGKTGTPQSAHFRPVSVRCSMPRLFMVIPEGWTERGDDGRGLNFCERRGNIEHCLQICARLSCHERTPARDGDGRSVGHPLRTHVSRSVIRIAVRLPTDMDGKAPVLRA